MPRLVPVLAPVLARALVAASCFVATTTLVHLARAERDEAAGARPTAPAPPDDEAAPRTAFPEADLGLAVLGVAYEHVVARPVSLRLAGGYTRAWYTSGDPRGGYLEARPFFFLAGPGAPAGLYVSPFGRIGFISASRDDVSGKSTGWTAGVTAGYGWLLGRVLVRVGAGAQLWRFDVDTSAGRAGLRGVLPDIDAIVGYGFLSISGGVRRKRRRYSHPAERNEFRASARRALSSRRDTEWGGTRFAA